jgi:hypothetical protein
MGNGINSGVSIKQLNPFRGREIYAWSLVNLYVIPAQAGIQKKLINRNWIPASTGMTMDMLFTNRTT